MNYKQLIRKLQDKPFPEDRDIQEACDIIADYEILAEQVNRMTKCYETEKEPRVGMLDTYFCPNCGKKVRFNYTHCNWCGQMIDWKKFRKDTR